MIYDHLLHHVSKFSFKKLPFILAKMKQKLKQRKDTFHNFDQDFVASQYIENHFHEMSIEVNEPKTIISNSVASFDIKKS